MIRKIARSLTLAGCLFALPSQAALPDNVLMQREAMRALTLMLQLQGEGMYSRQRNELQDSIDQLQAPHPATADDRQSYAIASYAEAVTLILADLEAGRVPTTEDMDLLYSELMQMIEALHKPDADSPYLSVLMTEYLTLRYAFTSYVGTPSAAEPGRHYYRTNISDLLQQLDRQLADLLPHSQDASLVARWSMLHHALSDIREGWTRTQSGNPFSPLVVTRNARVFSNQLSALLDNR